MTEPRELKVRLIGIGTGDPDQLTVEAIRALNDVDVFIAAEKNTAGKNTAGQDGTDGLLQIREQICAQHITGRFRIAKVTDPERDRRPSAQGYTTAVTDWHEARAEAYEKVLLGVGPGEVVGFLVWGDPSLYDSTIRVVERIRARGRLQLDYDVIPGISSVAVLAARHKLVLNRIGGPITIATGRELAETVAQGADNIVVMLDANLGCRELAGSWEIWWGANMGTPNESLVAGLLDDVAPQIEAARTAAKARDGWVMDTYLLRRAPR